MSDEIGLPAELPIEEGALVPSIRRASWWWRLAAWIGSQFAPRPYTAEEQILRRRGDDLEIALARANQRVVELEVELRQSKGTILVQERYIENLVDVIERDRQRVKAEKAVAALDQAVAKVGIERASPAEK